MKGTVKKNSTTTLEKPSFEEWYNGLSRPAKKAFKVGVLYAMKLQKENANLKAILNG